MTDSQSALKGARSWLAMVPGGAAVLLALVAAYQSYSNRTLQDQVIKNQVELVRAQTLTNLDNSLIQLMAKAAVENNDGAMRELLARNGVTMSAKPASPQPATSPSDNAK